MRTAVSAYSGWPVVVGCVQEWAIIGSTSPVDGLSTGTTLYREPPFASTVGPAMAARKTSLGFAFSDFRNVARSETVGHRCPIEGSGSPFGSRSSGSVLPASSAETHEESVTPSAGRDVGTPCGGGLPAHRWPNSLQREDVIAPSPEGSITELTPGSSNNELKATELSSSLVSMMTASCASVRRHPPLLASWVWSVGPGSSLPLAWA